MTTATRSLWPEDLQTMDVRGPEEILREQAELLERQTNGVLVGEVVDRVVQDRRVLCFDVIAPRIPTTIRLFEVQQSLELEYPVAIIPPDVQIPEFLQSERYVPGPMSLTGSAQKLADSLKNLGVRERNEWVAGSPAEFTEKLRRLLTSNGVKSIMLSLLARSNQQNGAGGSSQTATE